MIRAETDLAYRINSSVSGDTHKFSARYKHNPCIPPTCHHTQQADQFLSMNLKRAVKMCQHPCRYIQYSDESSSCVQLFLSTDVMCIHTTYESQSAWTTLSPHVDNEKQRMCQCSTATHPCNTLMSHVQLPFRNDVPHRECSSEQNMDEYRYSQEHI